MAIELKVTPEILQQKAGEFTGIVTEIEQRFERIEDISSKTRGYWNGEAGDQDRRGYESFKEEITYVLGRLKEHPDDLLRMAGIFKAAEDSITVRHQAELGTAGIV